MIPSKAILRKSKESYVKKSLLEEEIEVKVITGESDGIRTSIIEGVTEGDLIIIEYKVSEQDSKSTLDKEDSGDDKRSPPPRGGPPGRSSGFKGGAGQ